LKLVRAYIIVLVLAIGGYTWSAWNGYRLLGDDNESTQRRAGRSGHYFYHK